MLEWVLILTVILMVVGIAADWWRRSRPRVHLGSAGKVGQLSQPCMRRYNRPLSRWPAHSRLSEEDRQGFLQVWLSVQERFEDDPKAAVVYADLLISGLIQVANSQPPRAEGRAEILLHEKYSAARTIAFENTPWGVAPDALRRAMALYASVFEDLFRALGAPAARDWETVPHKIFPLGR